MKTSYRQVVHFSQLLDYEGRSSFIDAWVAGDAGFWAVDFADFCAKNPDRIEPIPMRLPCPSCNALHIDLGEFATKVHHTHACQNCGMVWRPAVVPTVGVRFLPGFKNEE